MIRLAAVLCVLASAAVADPAVVEPQGYRGAPYRAAVPDTLAGATVVGADAAAEWQQRSAVMIDVLPAVRRPEGLPDNVIWRAPKHQTIPEAIWLADTGYDRLAPEVEAEFAAALEGLTKDKSSPLVIFCQADCWMSWNAARRAVLLGYTHVAWFPGGTDEWAASGRPLIEATPAN